MNLMADIAHIDLKLRHKQFELEQKATDLSEKLKANYSKGGMKEEWQQEDWQQEDWQQEDWQQELQQVEHAILRIKQGTYQQCELCGWRIDNKRLTVLPYTALCLNCAT